MTKRKNERRGAKKEMVREKKENQGESRRVKVWDAKRGGEKTGATIGGAGEGKGERGQGRVGVIVPDKSCESHTEGKAASRPWESITREAGKSQICGLYKYY